MGAAFITATWIAARRAKRIGLDPKLVWDVAVWIFIAAMVGSRVFHVLFYEPRYYIEHPLAALDPREPARQCFVHHRRVIRTFNRFDTVLAITRLVRHAVAQHHAARNRVCTLDI